MIAWDKAKRHECPKCGKVWYCGGNGCSEINCLCDSCDSRSLTTVDKKCNEAKVKRDWRIA